VFVPVAAIVADRFGSQIKLARRRPLGLVDLLPPKGQNTEARDQPCKTAACGTNAGQTSIHKGISPAMESGRKLAHDLLGNEFGDAYVGALIGAPLTII